MAAHEPKLYWIGINLVKGIGAMRFRNLLETFSDAETAWNASREALRGAGLSAKLVESLCQLRAQVNLERIWDRFQDQNVQVLTWDDEYPHRLKEIEQPPPVMYLRSELKLEDEWAVAVVGTRRITAYGQPVGDKVVGTLARNGVTGVSGPARAVVDHIHSQIGMSIKKVPSKLALMELKGMMRQVGGMNYVWVREQQAEYRTESDSESTTSDQRPVLFPRSPNRYSLIAS